MNIAAMSESEHTVSRKELKVEEKITLASKLSEIARVPPWLENLAARYRIPERVRFGMDVCLEEVLSNIVRHGYRGAPDHAILVTYGNPRIGTFTLVIEDEAPFFNPLLSRDERVGSLEQASEGGQGIRLVRQFSDKLDYEATATGNRLTICFVVPEASRTAV